ncbi:FA2H family protein [Megaselia abdita]
MQPILVKYRNETFDISSLINKHPGGINTLKGLENTDMTSRFLKGPPHSDAAMYLMNEYKVSDPAHLNNNNEGEIIQKDVSMEHLVDWDRAMLPQIKNIAEHYDEWVHKPVDRELRLFDAWYLEILTKTPWWIVALFWSPVISYIIISEVLKLQFQTALIKFIIGVGFWTFLEYTLHRFLFHMKVSKSNGIACTFHFLLHGLHHKVPFDSGRLVFPPFPAVIIATIIYYPLSFIFDSPRMLLAGGLFGYLCYDLMHYYLHYGNPTFWHMYQMKRYHYQHHFTHQDLGYGISSPLWDLVFGTNIRLRKLKNKLKWK